MSDIHEKRSHKKGLAPGTLTYSGDSPGKPSEIEIFSFNEEKYTEIVSARKEDLRQCWESDGTTEWVNIFGLADVKLIEDLGEFYRLHPLLLEDIVSSHQRPKTDEYDNALYVVARMLEADETGSGVVSEQVSFVLMDKTLMVFQENEGDVFNSVRERIRRNKGRTRRLGADFLLYSLLDTIVDNYFSVLEKIGEQLELVEDELLDGPNTKTLQRIHELKREMIRVKKSVWPLRDVVSHLMRSDHQRVSSETRLFMKDLYDHVIQVIETTETYRDLLSGMTEIYLNSVNNRMNEVMKVLTIIATIFIPLTFIAGVYGMNFKYMPELDWKAGYPFSLMLMAAVAIGMIIYFRRKRWI